MKKESQKGKVSRESRDHLARSLTRSGSPHTRKTCSRPSSRGSSSSLPEDPWHRVCQLYTYLTLSNNNSRPIAPTNRQIWPKAPILDWTTWLLTIYPLHLSSTKVTRACSQIRRGWSSYVGIAASWSWFMTIDKCVGLQRSCRTSAYLKLQSGVSTVDTYH